MTAAIRIAEPGEGELLHELAGATFGLACPPGTPPGDVVEFVATQLSAARFEGYLADPDRRVLVATQDGAFVGYVMLISTAPTDPDVAAVVTARPTVELSKFYILAEWHGSGLAAELMRAAIDTAQLGGAKTLWLGVNQLNERANRFYEKSGFVVVGTKQFALGGRLEDDFVRERTL